MKNNTVMTVSALQKRVQQIISLIEDKAVLEKINQIIDKTSKVYILSEFELAKLKEADEDLKNGAVFSQEEMDKHFEKWINER